MASVEENDKTVIINDTDITDDTTTIIKYKDTPPIDSIPMDERRRFFIKVMMIIRLTFRGYFGVKFSNKWGHFVDMHMSKAIHNYADWLEYPNGDHILDTHTCSIIAVAVSSDGYQLFTGDGDGEIKVWDLLKLELIKQWMAHDKGIWDLSCHPKLLASCGDDSKIKIWNPYSYDLIRTLEGHTARVWTVSLNAKATQIISASDDNSLRLWSVKRRVCLRELTGHGAGVRGGYFIGNMIVSGSQDRSLRVWDPASGVQVESKQKGLDSGIFGLCVNCDSSMIACLCLVLGFTVFHWPKMTVVFRATGDSYCGAFHPSKPNVFAVGGFSTKVINLYDTNNGDQIARLEGHGSTIFHLSFSIDGSRLFSVSQDNSTRMWDLSKIL